MPKLTKQNQMQDQNISYNNITILDQSYFGFEAKNINLINKNNKIDTII